MHEEGVWALAADDVFQTVYSAGRDRKVYAVELSQGIYICSTLYYLVNMSLRGPSKSIRISRNFTLTVASCISVIMPGDFKVA